MAKYLDASVTAAAHAVIKSGATTLLLLSSSESTYAGLAAKTLATKTINATGWTVANGVLTVPSITSISISTSGTVRAFALTNGSTIEYLCDYCAGSTDGTTGGTAVTSGQLYDLATCTLTINQPT